MARLTLKRIVAISAEHAGVSVAELQSDAKPRPLVTVRHRTFLAVRTLRPDLSYPEIGRRMGGKDHTTVLAGVRRAEERISRSPEEAIAYQELLGLCRAEASILDSLAVGVSKSPDAAERARLSQADRLDQTIHLVGEVLADLCRAQERAADATGDLFEWRAA